MLIVLSLGSCGKARCRGSLRKGPWCDQSTGWLLGGQRLSRQLVRGAFGRACPTQCLRCQVRQVEHCRFAYLAAKVAVFGVCVHQKAVWHSAKADAPPGCGQRDLCYGCRIARLGDLRARKKRDLIALKTQTAVYRFLKKQWTAVCCYASMVDFEMNAKRLIVIVLATGIAICVICGNVNKVAIPRLKVFIFLVVWSTRTR